MLLDRRKLFESIQQVLISGNSATLIVGKRDSWRSDCLSIGTHHGKISQGKSDIRIFFDGFVIFITLPASKRLTPTSESLAF